LKLHHRASLRRALRSKALRRALMVLVGLELLAMSAWGALSLGRSPGHFEFALATIAVPLAAIVGFLCGGAQSSGRRGSRGVRVGVVGKQREG
jgi:hypothetical protein